MSDLISVDLVPSWLDAFLIGRKTTANNGNFSDRLLAIILQLTNKLSCVSSAMKISAFPWRENWISFVQQFIWTCWQTVRCFRRIASYPPREFTAKCLLSEKSFYTKRDGLLQFMWRLLRSIGGLGFMNGLVILESVLPTEILVGIVDLCGRINENSGWDTFTKHFTIRSPWWYRWNVSEAVANKVLQEEVPEFEKLFPFREEKRIPCTVSGTDGNMPFSFVSLLGSFWPCVLSIHNVGRDLLACTSRPLLWSILSSKHS